MTKLSHPLFAVAALSLLAAACGSPTAAAAAPKASPSAGCFTPGPRPSGSPGGQFGQFQRPAVSGTITSLTAGSMTVHDQRTNSDVQVGFDASVQVRQGQQPGQVSDLKVGDSVSVQGQQSGTAVQATVISVRPAGAGPSPGARRGRPCPAPTAA